MNNRNKEKLRLVFDAADKTDGKCLNDYLLKGSDLLSPLLGIMLRFRKHKIAVTGYINDASSGKITLRRPKLTSVFMEK